MLNYLEKELYEKLSKDSKTFDFLQQSSLDGIWYWDLENPENEWMSEKFWTELGYDPKYMSHSHSSWHNIIFHEDLQKAKIATEKHLNNPNIPLDIIVRYRHKNGSTVFIRRR